MLRRIIALLLCVLLLGSAALAEADAPGNAVPAEDQPLKDRLTAQDGDETAADAPVESAPYIPDALDRVIVSGDDRVTVNNPDYYPYSAIAYMVVHASCGCDWVGSAFMIGPRGCLTAAHCLVCTKHYKPADKLTLYFGYKSDRNYFFKYDDLNYREGTRYWYGTDFSQTGGYDDEWDFGYILLNERVGDRTGWFGVSALTDSDVSSKYLTVAGYRDGALKYDSDFATVETSNIISYQADTQPGNSGGPVFFYTSDDIYATAINVAESYDTMRNYARRINNQLFSDLQANGLFN